MAERIEPLDVLEKYFFAGSAEDELEQLSEVFVPDENIRKVMRSSTKRFHLILGTKGVGKSALLHDESLYARKAGVSVFLKPNDLNVEISADEKALAGIKRKLYQALLETVAAKLGETLGGKIADASEQILRFEALANGATPDVVERLAKVSGSVGVISGYDFSKLIPENPARNLNMLAKSIEGHVGKKKTNIYVYIDDTDQISSPSDDNQLNRIWGLILAARELAQKVGTAHVCVSLRTSVWSHLVVGTDGQMDQIDHISPHVLHLDASEGELVHIFRRRVEVAAQSYKKQVPSVKSHNDLLLFFEAETLELPESATREKRKWESFLAKNSRNRARDLIQYVNKLIELSRKRGIITQSPVFSAAIAYSRDRITFLVAEFGADFSPIREIVESLRKMTDELSFNDLYQHLSTLPSSFTVTIRGKILRPGEKTSALKILAALYEMGVINARIVSPSSTRGFEHKTFKDYPEFVTEANWNRLQKCHWEIHPAYRSWLHELRREGDRVLGMVKRR